MGPDVRLGDGIEIEFGTGMRVVADASRPDGDLNILSHAHGDHLYTTPPSDILCSETTAALAKHRREGVAPPTRVDDPRVELVDGGHIPGSTAALIEENGTRVLYTGDISIRDRFLLDGFDPVSADVLVIESTYGKPAYEFPPQEEAESTLVNWLNETIDQPVITFGYTLGRAQELQLLAMESDRETIYVSEAIKDTNDVLERHLEVVFDVELYTEDSRLTSGDILILPGQTNNLAFVDSLSEESGAIRVGASGWAVDSSFKYRGGFDETFVLSDHCDFPELLSVVEAVNPEVVYTTHGFTESLAKEITSRLGYQTRALKANQSTLGDF